MRDYLEAPEMISGKGHNHGIDWWALGVVIYEMLVGIPPFYNKNKHHLYKAIAEAPVKYPDPVKHGIKISEEAKDLINKVSSEESYASSCWTKT